MKNELSEVSSQMRQLGKHKLAAEVEEIVSQTELRVRVASGRTIASGGERHQYGDWVQVIDANGDEVGYWDKEEWKEDPEGVMGAILAAAVSTTKR